MGTNFFTNEGVLPITISLPSLNGLCCKLIEMAVLIYILDFMLG